MTVRQNMGFALRLASVPKSESDAKVAEAARVLQLEDLLDRTPKALSGGQRQRVAIGRAIVREPKAFLFDEPLSNLDASLRGQMRIELANLHETLKATTIYVTHDQIEAMTMATKIVVLRDGCVEQIGSPLDLYQHPDNLFVASFLGSPAINLLPATVLSTNGSGVEVTLAQGHNLQIPIAAGSLREGGKVTLGIRPETLRVAADGPLAGEVRLVERLGGLTLLHVVLAGDTPVTVQSDSTDVTEARKQVRLTFDPAGVHVFDESGQAVERLQHRTLAA